MSCQKKTVAYCMRTPIAGQEPTFWLSSPAADEAKRFNVVSEIEACQKLQHINSMQFMSCDKAFGLTVKDWSVWRQNVA
ncbi:MAG: hypothetical protein ACLRWM_08080 [Streptococcus sp.]